MMSTDTTIKGSTLLIQTQNDPRFDVFFDSSTLPKLSPTQADSCDSLLTKEECMPHLKVFAKASLPVRMA